MNTKWNKKAFQWDVHHPLAPTMHSSIATSVSTGGWAPEVIKFEKVSTDGHQMSLAWGPLQ